MIRFTCSNCSRLISVDEKHSGKKGKCPKCGGVVVVPERSTIIEFHCESCGHKIKVPDSYGGKKGKCPKCHEPVVIPSLEKDQAIAVEMARITCPICGQAIEVSEHASEEFIECPGCGSYVDTLSDSIPAASVESDTSIPRTADDDPYQEPPDASEEPTGVDRRLIVLISAAAAVVVVGLVILVVVLLLSRPRPQQEVADTRESPIELQLDQVKKFVERHIALLESGEIDEARQSLTSGLADDAYKPQVERLSIQIGKSRIIDMDCTRTQREQHPEGERVLLWYNLRCEEGTQTVIASVAQLEQELTIDGIATRNHFGNTVSIGTRSFAELSQVGSTTTRRISRPSPGKFYFALAIGFAIGTVFSAGCLWIGMKLTNVEGTFGTMLGIAAISSLASFALAFIGLMPCVGWLINIIVMFVLICKWTDAEFWPDAIGMVLIAGVVGILARIFLDFLISMA